MTTSPDKPDSTQEPEVPELKRKQCNEPKTPLEWFEWATRDHINVDQMLKGYPSSFVEGIRRAQTQSFEAGYEKGCLKLLESVEQARREAIKECDKILSDHCHNYCPNSGDCMAFEEVRDLLVEKK